MSDPAAWLRKAQTELGELGPTAEVDPADAWRAVVLVARLLGAPDAPVPPVEIVQCLPQILSAAGSPEPERVLDRLADDLSSDGDAWGPLLDTLLDVDDTIGVLDLSGQREQARELAGRATALVSLYPERTFPLGPFAAMRLATLRDDVATARLWRAVERAPADLLADVLPAIQTPSKPSRTARPDFRARERAFTVPRDLQLTAAASPADEPRELAADGAETGAWIYAERGRMLLEVRDIGSPTCTVTLAAQRAEDHAEVGRVDLEVAISGTTAYADLGPWAGGDNVLHRLVAETGLTAAELRIRLLVTHG